MDVLVNNAGIVHGGPFLDVPVERHLATYRVNVLGLVAVTHAFLPDLIASADSHLVNIASASGYIGLPHGSTYASSKWAVIGFSESLLLELELHGHRHVHVTTVCPSYVTTGLFDGARAARTTSLLSPERLAAQNHTRGPGQPARRANAVAGESDALSQGRPSIPTVLRDGGAARGEHEHGQVARARRVGATLGHRRRGRLVLLVAIHVSHVGDVRHAARDAAVPLRLPTMPGASRNKARRPGRRAR